MLRRATRQKDVALLKKAIAEAVKAGLPELGPDVRKARDALEKLGGGREG